jgi:hypothetical protein
MAKKKKRKFIQGKKVKFYHNPANVKPHSAGAKITIMQPFTHSDSGIAGLMPAIFGGTWIWHRKNAKAYIEFYENDILKNPPSAIESMYILSHHLILDLWLSFEHIFNDIIKANFDRVTFEDFEQKNLDEKLEKIREVEKFGFLKTDPRVETLKNDLTILRNAVIHPKMATTIYNSDPHNYKTIPHVWLHSGSYKKTCGDLLDLLNDLWTSSKKSPQ